MLKTITIALHSLTLTACGTLERHEPKNVAPSAELASLYAERLETYNSLTAANAGWPSVDDCDSTLWAGLACAGGAPVAYTKAEYSPGVIHRRPVRACWTPEAGDVGSKSTVSNDMLLGHMLCAWSNKDAGAFQRLAGYGEQHDWIMGAPVTEPGDVILKPNQIGMTGRAIYVLSGGADNRYYRRLFRFYAPVEKDYERHLQAIGIALQGEITEAIRKAGLDASLDVGRSLIDINGDMLARLEELVRAEPENPLFAVALGVYSGDMAKGVELLLRNDAPRPTYVRSKDRHADDLYWRAEWLFAARLALNRMR